MSPSRPFFESPSGEIDTSQIVYEAVPLAKLVGVVAVVALVPLVLQFVLIELIGMFPVVGFLLSLAVQFVLAVGSGIVLTYVIVRALHLADT